MMPRTAILATLTLLVCLVVGATGAWVYQQYAAFQQMQALFPQIVNVINAHEAALQKITGTPSIAPPASGAGAGATPPSK